MNRDWNTLARRISDVLSPPVLAVPTLLVGVWTSETAEAFRFAALYFLMAVVIPASYLVWLLRSGRITDVHLPNRRDRRAPFLVFLLCSLAGLCVLIWLGAPTPLVASVAAL